MIVAASMTVLALPALVSASSTTVSGVIPRALPFNINGSTGTWQVDGSGVLLQAVNQWSPAKDVTVNISAGTALLGPDNKPIDEFTVSAASSPPNPPAGNHILAAFDFKPDGATFYPTGIQISIKFDPSKVLTGEVVVIAFYNASASAWQYIAGIVNSGNTAVFTVYHFTIYGVLAGSGNTTPTPTPTRVYQAPVVVPQPTVTAEPTETAQSGTPPPTQMPTVIPTATLPAPTPESTAEPTSTTEPEEQMKAPGSKMSTPTPVVAVLTTFHKGSHHIHSWLWILLVTIWSLVVVLWLWIIFVVLKRYRYQYNRAGQ
jgi:hypothetical protein